MASSLTIWTSKSTLPLESRVASYIGATRNSNISFDSISISECQPSEAILMVNNAFYRLVKMTMADTTLHIIAVLPIWDNDFQGQVELLTESINALKNKVSLHIICLSNGLKHLFSEVDKNNVNPYQNRIEYLSRLSFEPDKSFSFSLIDDYAANGAPIGFTIDSLSHYIALFQILITQNYYKVFSPSLMSTYRDHNLSIGVSSLSFDKDATVKQLLGLAFLSALDKVGINQTKVDAQKAANNAELFLAGIENRYPSFFENQIRPLYRDSNLDMGTSVAKASEILDKNLSDIHNDIIKLLRSEDLSFPEKESVLALILGRDNLNIRGMQYDHQGMILDDVCQVPIDLYVNTFNEFCKDSGLLPIRGSYPLLKKYKWNDDNDEFEDSAENDEALNPLPEIKRLKQSILNTTAFVRDKSEELIELLESEKHRKNVDEIHRKWSRPSGNLSDIQYKEQPLDEKYIPLPGLIKKKSVDLREFFNSVRNQSNLGSCTSFAVTAMYEAMMNIYGCEDKIDLSPAYLFYYSNIINNRPDGGSNFHEQLEVLGKHGICLEDLHHYDADNPSRKPSTKAEDDASLHRVLVAKEIVIADEPDKSETIKLNHAVLTSALSEGYPIGISLKIFDNFGDDGPFILHPDDSTESKESGWHAMVIVGYSEDNNFYIVRNSWGKDFGDNGYCYIPTAYIEDPDYMNFACIITETTDQHQERSIKIPSVIADFAATESEIRIAAVRNVVTMARIQLKSDQKLYSEYYKYYQNLIQQITMPNIQKKILEAAEIAKTKDFIDADSVKTELENSFVSRLDKHKQNLQYTIISLFIVAAILGGIYFLTGLNITGIISLICCIFAVISIMGYKWNVKIQRKKLQDELDEIALYADRQAKELFEMQIKFHIAGMWLRRYHKLSNQLGNIYERLVSYNETLRGWQSQYTAKVETLDKIDGEMFRVIDATPNLKEFFRVNQKIILKDIDLIKVFEEYQVTNEKLEETHRRLQDLIYKATSQLLMDFDIIEYLLGKDYPYLSPINIQDEIYTLTTVGQPSYNNISLNSTAPIRFIFTGAMGQQKIRWESKIAPLFPLLPNHLEITDNTTIILITLDPIPLLNC